MVLNRLKSRLFSSNDQNGLEKLRELLAERESVLNLSATYGEPRPNLQDEPTVVFPYLVTNGDGEPYRSGAKEFPLPDDGLQDEDASLVRFIATRHGIDPSEVTFDHLAAVSGTSATASLNDNGDVEVSV